MNKLKLTCIASLMAVGVAQASVPCNGFEIKVNNALADNLLVTRVALNGASLQPGSIQKISGHSSEVFTVNNSSENVGMEGEMTFHTISVPSKKVKIRFNLVNKGLVCEHSELNVDGNDYSVDKARLPGKVEYTISNG